MDIIANMYDRIRLSDYSLHVAQKIPISRKQTIRVINNKRNGQRLVANGVMFGLKPIISIKVFFFKDSTRVSYLFARAKSNGVLPFASLASFMLPLMTSNLTTLELFPLTAKCKGEWPSWS